MNKNLFNVFYSCKGISTDTRNIKLDSLFICIKGNNFDGNEFALKALQKGAKHIIVDNKKYFLDNGRMTLVKNSIEYLQKLAQFHRNKFKIPIIGITGSNGKTTTKELLNSVLSKKYNILSTIGNLNNHLGVPFTILRMNESHDIAIIEMGANKFGDIKELCEISRPTHGIITNIGKAHLEGFINFEGVLKTKKELYESIQKSNGIIVVNNDDQVLKSNIPKGIKTYLYGTNSKNISGELTGLSPFIQMYWKYDSFKSDIISTKMIGKYNFYNFLSAITFGVIFKVPFKDISQAIIDYSPENNRSQVKKTKLNTIILDCYNANPSSVKEAIESFAISSNSNKFFILGEMKELGDKSYLEHQKIIKIAEKLKLKGYTVGNEFKKIKSNTILKHFKDTPDLIKNIKKSPLKDKLILIKGSRSVELEILEKHL
ncbi:MAG: UDP-N-acetylmuramoyl-tripeptide--D-alanyl-D-alanine ligase [Crocinitomicaceae bacterium]|nr:UDP-N-acetylmuramoyl-tripeptide--D-alanyl-D-alanine ligase [Crocinitomicaceae bacterium]|tara:strand:+ start:61556 stop:62845 length:1290 start_codon:yes stop_codon:yes gene_type:complete